jgi:hypothetical protein
LSGVLIACLWTACAQPRGAGPLPASADPSIEAEHRLWADIAAAQRDGRHEVAIRTLKRVLAAYPKSPRTPEAHWRLGQSLEQAGDLTAAFSEYQTLLEMEPLLVAPDSYQSLARQRLDEWQHQGTVAHQRPHGHTALLVSPASVAVLPRTDLWFEKIRASGITVLMLDVACDAVCGERVRAVSSEDESPIGRQTGVVFSTVHAPVVRPLLNTLIPDAHRAGLSVIAVVDLLRAPWLESRGDWHASVFDPRTRTIRPWPTLDVLNPSVHSHLVAFLSDLAGTDIDGILIRTRSRNSFAYEVSETALAGFQAQYQESSAAVTEALMKSAGASRSDQLSQPKGDAATSEQGTDTLWHWVGWKARQELDALAQLRREVQQVKHGLRVILEAHAEAASEPLWALVNYGEDVAEASRRGFDILLNGSARITDLQQTAALVKQAEMKAMRKPVTGQPTTQQLWVLASLKGLTSRTDHSDLLRHAERVRVREDVNVLLVPEAGESLP